jgi:DNA/RNA-binding domain of Phe-tRNA-synthetase-like protein
VGREAGITEEQLREITEYEQSTAFSPLEKLVIEYAVEMTKTPVEVSDTLFAALREHFDEAQLVELSATIAWENYRARFNHAFEKLRVSLEALTARFLSRLSDRRSLKVYQGKRARKWMYRKFS